MHTLPVELSSFVGRERELEELRNYLGTTRLLTLTRDRRSGALTYVLKDVDPERLAKSIRDAHAGRFLLDDALTRRVILRLAANVHRPPREATRLTEKEQAVPKMVM